MPIASNELVYDCFLTDLKLCGMGFHVKLNMLFTEVCDSLYFCLSMFGYICEWMPMLMYFCVFVCSDVAALSSPGAMCVVGDDSPLRSRRHSWRQQIFLRVATPQKGSDTKGNTLLKYIMQVTSNITYINYT